MKKVYRTIATFDSKSKPGKVYTVKVDEAGNLSCDCPKWIFSKGGIRDCYHVRVVKSEMKNSRTRKNSLIVPITAATITMQRMERERKEKEKKKSVGLRWNPKSLYEDFHGTLPVRKRPVYYEEPKGEIIKIGRLARIEYDPEPPSKLTGTRYTHEGGDLGHKVIKSNAILATNKSGTQLYIVREKKSKYPRFSARGIEG